jgi:hypothetical protein
MLLAMLLALGHIAGTAALPLRSSPALPQHTSINLSDIRQARRLATTHAPKLSSRLGSLAQQTPDSSPDTHAGLRIDADRVLVTIAMQHEGQAGAMFADLPTMQADVLAHHARWIDAWVPIGMLSDVAQRPGVGFVHEAALPVPPPPTPPVGASSLARATQNTRQGVEASNAAVWQRSGYTGRGLQVAVFGSFAALQEAQSNGALPSIATYGMLDTTSRTGTASAEVVFAMAPQAALTLASPMSATQMASYIVALAQNGHDIILSSMGFFNTGPGDGSGALASAIRTATTTYDSVYVQAAGDHAEYHWDGVFQDSGDGTQVFGANNVNELHVVAGERREVPANYPLVFYLRWNNWPRTTQDYDLYLVRWSGTTWDIVASSINDQQGGNLPPTEMVAHTTEQAGIYGIFIDKYGANGSQVLDLMGVGALPLEVNVQARSLTDPATPASALAVAALDVTTGARLASSSVGPAHGTGGTLEAGNNQPRLTGFAHVDTWSYGSQGFGGSAAAAAHVAGAAALVRQALPALSAAEVRQWLEARAIDLGAAGYDYAYGAGQLYLGEPPAAPSGEETVFLPLIIKWHTSQP